MADVKPDPERICAAQLRAARAMLGWTQRDLARAAEVSLRRLKTLEGPPAPEDLAPLACRPATAARLRLACEGAGVAFAWDGGAVAVARRA